MTVKSTTRFPPKGFIIVNLLLKKKSIKRFIRSIEFTEDDYKPVLGSIVDGEEVTDPFRKQSPHLSDQNLSNPVIQEVLVTSRCLFGPSIKIEKVCVLISEAGGEEQIAHQDVNCEHMMKLKENEVCVSFVLALMNNTKVIVYQGCFDHPYKNKKVVVKLRKGEIIFFRSDLFHSGASYDERNYRIHGFLNPSNIRFDDQILTVPVTPKCKTCLTPYKEMKQMYSHSYGCTLHPEHQDRKNKKNKRRRENGGRCPIEGCTHDYVYQHYDGLRRHIRRCHKKSTSTVSSESEDFD